MMINIRNERMLCVILNPSHQLRVMILPAVSELVIHINILFLKLKMKMNIV